MVINFVGNVSCWELCSGSSYKMLGNAVIKYGIKTIYVGNIVQVGIRNDDIISIQESIVLQAILVMDFFRLAYGIRISIALQNTIFKQILSHWGLS